MIDSLIAFSIWLSEINSEKILLSLQQRCNILWLIGLLRLFSIFLELNSGPISRLEILRDFCHFSTWKNRPHAVIVLTMRHMCKAFVDSDNNDIIFLLPFPLLKNGQRNHHSTIRCVGFYSSQPSCGWQGDLWDIRNTLSHQYGRKYQEFKSIGGHFSMLC